MRPEEVPGLRCRPARTLNEFRMVLDLHAHVYTDRGIVSSILDEGLRDRWIDDSIYFGAFFGDKVVGTARLIPYSSDFHLFDLFDIYDEWAERLADVQLEGQAFEVSALSVPKVAPGGYTAVSAALYRAMFHFSLAEEHYLWFAGVSPVLGRLLNRRLGIPMQIIGPQVDCFGAPRQPVLIDLITFLSRAHEGAPAEYEYFTRGLEIDLRDRPAAIVDTVAPPEFVRRSR